MPVHKELFTAEVLRVLKHSTSFLAVIPDKSSLVKDNATIHINDIGLEPEVLINNSTYPIPVVDYDDDDIVISLDKFDTKNTRVREEQLYAVTYDVMGEVTDAHGNALDQSHAKKAAHALAPAANTTATPIVEATGGTDNGTIERKSITKKDIISLKKLFDLLGVPTENRYLVLHPEHVAQLLELDNAFSLQYTNTKEGTVLKLYGFNILEYSFNPVYNASNVKLDFNAALGDTDSYCSFAFYAPDTFKGMTEPTMHYREAAIDPEQRANTAGFRNRFIALPLKQRAIGAIVSKPIA
ncbi:hypothetical protein V9L05_19945 [Bernardetia sp. Wsw4-3y2]|uniref:phage major capsid protein n=1 Tax=Bernardetia sp. Wsw4-3y2 TaxID=3127471 RepID=UPI0030CD8FD2